MLRLLVCWRVRCRLLVLLLRPLLVLRVLICPIRCGVHPILSVGGMATVPAGLLVALLLPVLLLRVGWPLRLLLPGLLRPLRRRRLLRRLLHLVLL